jgi:hypothetical protein
LLLQGRGERHHAFTESLQKNGVFSALLPVQLRAKNGIINKIGGLFPFNKENRKEEEAKEQSL